MLRVNLNYIEKFTWLENIAVSVTKLITLVDMMNKQEIDKFLYMIYSFTLNLIF